MGIVLAALIGAAAFFVVIGPSILDVRNIGWLGEGDSAQHYLGWQFFRSVPWSFPPGLNPAFGMELGNAIVYSDSIPVFALLFKLFAAWLPEPFQYFGLWILACCVLQAVAAWLLLGRAATDWRLRVLGCGYFAFAPIMFARMGGHIALASHFLVLAALWLALRQGRGGRTWAWCLLLALAALIHAYLLFMAMALWSSSLLDARRRGERDWRAVGGEAAAVVAVLAGALWMAGYFSVGTGASFNDFGWYKMNLLALVNPMGWSRVLPTIAHGGGEYEGFNYFGLGGLFLAGCALARYRKWSGAARELARRMPFVLLALVVLTFYAVSNVIGLAGYSFRVDLPDAVLKFCNVFRASGRLFWPVYYVLLLGCIAAVWHSYRVRTASVLLAAGLAIQLADTSAGWGLRHRLAQPSVSSWATPLQDPFWEEAARQYSAVRRMNPGSNKPHWATFSSYAGRNGMDTDFVYLARVDGDRLDALQQRAYDIQSGRLALDPESLYILDARASRAFLLRSPASQALLAHVDGFDVLAPAWHRCGGCVQPAALPAGRRLAPVMLGQDVSMSGEEGARYLTYGWSEVERWGVWSEHDRAELGFAHSLPARFRLTLSAHAFGQNAQEPFRLRVGTAEHVFSLSSQTSDVQIDVANPDGARSIEFLIPSAVSPLSQGKSDDRRRLGMGLVGFRIDALAP